MEGQMKTSFRFSWTKPCKRAFVSGTFNDFHLDMLTGDNDKFLNSMVQPGRIYYRFKIDGLYQVDTSKPTTLYEKTLYNYADITAPTLQINSKLKEKPELKAPNSNKSTCKSSSATSLTTSPYRTRPLSTFRNSISLSNIIKIQAWIRSVIQRIRFKRYLKHIRTVKNRKNISAETTFDAHDGYEKLRKKVEVLTEENQRLRKDCKILQSKALTCKPPLKKLDVYKTTRNFKTGSFLRLNVRDGGRLLNSVSPIKGKFD
ncbi:unnamed protein product [Blepharisma stoltei]|uniref:AMP-activated protein kinase glycogen-binding domain-containing protein n=1 Tax=Blepharisma stoltei TaxID=1481888 RepID=A0AAU9IUZ2_9CILI|nr:unnamed protein product [Blepharisma stoltei]